MKILHLAAEMYPLCKIGGLGDVVGALLKEQVKRGDNVSIALPYYQSIQNKNIFFSQNIDFNRPDLQVEAWTSQHEGIQIFLIKDIASSRFFNRENIYGEHDDKSRFCCFSSGVMHLLMQRKDLVPDVIHLHDWPASFAAFFKPFQEFKDVRFVCTIHNPEEQGKLLLSNLIHFDIPFESCLPSTSTINGLAEAIKRVDVVTTVSPNYSFEIQEEPLGCGLASLFKERFDVGRLHGILNGIDLDIWNPSTDHYLPEQYDERTLSFTKGQRASQKEKIFQLVAEELGLKWRPDKPFACSISRLSRQKGIDLLQIAARWIVEQGGTFVCLGIAYEENFRLQMEELDRYLRPYGCWIAQQNEGLAHRLLGGSDLFLMPSLFEPCGLTQMMALKYGSLPVVRHTGGLVDTIFDFDFSEQIKEKRNGFVFTDPTQKGVLSAVKRAFEKWKDPMAWKKAVLQAMQFSRGWKEAAEQLHALYQKENS